MSKIGTCTCTTSLTGGERTEALPSQRPRAFKSQRASRNVALVDALQFEIVEFDQEDARQAGEVRAVLAARGTPIGPYDVLIAGQAKARELILVTRNVWRVKFRLMPEWQV